MPYSQQDSGVKRSVRQRRLADGTKEYCARFAVRSIPMSLLRRKSCSALASTIFESPLHRTKITCTIFFVPSAKRRCRTDLLTPEPQRELIPHYDEEVARAGAFPRICSTERGKRGVCIWHMIRSHLSKK